MVKFRNKTIVTTSWDDGHKLDLRLAKLLKKYNLHGTFYVCPEHREFKKSDLLFETDILLLSRDFEIGAHTITHLDLTKIPLKKAGEEINESKEYLEKLLNKKIYAFCYPYGEYNYNIKNLVKSSGFILARTTKRFEHTLGNDAFSLPTTFHTYNHFINDIRHILKFSKLRLNKLFKYTDWEYLAMDLFDHDLENKGIFHLWGHSWEIEKFNAWDKLERVLSYISKRQKVLYLSNSELIHKSEDMQVVNLQ